MRDQKYLQFLDILLDYFVSIWLTHYMNCYLFLTELRKLRVELLVSSYIDR